jgi:hypothetical protein
MWDSAYTGIFYACSLLIVFYNAKLIIEPVDRNIRGFTGNKPIKKQKLTAPIFKSVLAKRWKQKGSKGLRE